MTNFTRRTFLGHSMAATGFALGSLATAAARGGEPQQAAEEKGAVPPATFNDPGLHLFVDDHELEKVENLLRVVNRPQKHPEPVVVSDQPWEGERAQAWGSVIQEPDGLLRLWYFAFNTERKANELDRGGYAYAESRDGIHWIKPPLGVVEYKGSKENNLFYTCAPDSKNLVDEELARRGLGLPALDAEGKQIGVINNLDGLTVVRDDNEADPQKRYKLIANMQDHRMWAPYSRERYPDVTEEQVKQARAVFGQYVDTSPDGIHWARRPRRMVGSVGDYMMVTRDHRNRRWWLNERAHGRGGRNAALRTSPDLVHWTDPVIVFDNEADSEFGRLHEWHGGITPFNYGNLNLGFLEKWCNAGFGNTCELVSNRDGQPWQRVAPGTPFLDIGPEGAFDRVLIYPTHNAPIRIGDKLFIFYTGASNPTDPKKGLPMSIGVATIGLDRFAALANWRRNTGRITTRPVEVKHPRLEINVEPVDHGGVRIGVATPDGAMVPGYTLEDSRIELDRSRLRTPVRWKDKADLAELKGKNVVLHFEIKGGAIYSYRFFDTA